jgi:hypothetical protein
MYRNVYNHSKVAVFEEMIKLAVRRSGIAEEEFKWMDDGELLAALASRPGIPSIICQMVKDEKPYERMNGLTLKSNRDENLPIAQGLSKEGDLAGRIAKYAGMRQDQVLVVFRLPKEEDGRNYLPMALDDGSFCNLFEYDDRGDAMRAFQRPASKFYAMFAVLDADYKQRKMISSMVESLVDKARKAA